MSVDPAMGFDSGGTVGAVATCRAVTPGSSVPGWLLVPWGRLEQGPAGSGDGADAVDRVGEFLCLGPGFGDPQDQVAGWFDQASRSVQQPVPATRSPA